MATKWQHFVVEVDRRYRPDERRAIGLEICDAIRRRVSRGIGFKDGRDFDLTANRPYSKEYVESLDFKIAGKAKTPVNLFLSGDMLASLEYLEEFSGEGKVVVGYNPGTDENGKADGNIRGTYGKSRPIPGKDRPFLGLPKKEIEKILARYPLLGEAARTEEQLSIYRQAAAISQRIARMTALEED